MNLGFRLPTRPRETSHRLPTKQSLGDERPEEDTPMPKLVRTLAEYLIKIGSRICTFFGSPVHIYIHKGQGG